MEPDNLSKRVVNFWVMSSILALGGFAAYLHPCNIFTVIAVAGWTPIISKLLHKLLHSPWEVIPGRNRYIYVCLIISLLSSLLGPFLRDVPIRIWSLDNFFACLAGSIVGIVVVSHIGYYKK
ncbi:MAG TPA: hypothetical protein VMY59_07780 [Candidatus Thermoplasmatota archaeon]|nr:hypothetical protein [Candidatus Thermoplasmatota archaeon]